MPQLSRRQVLSLIPATGVFIAASPLRAGASAVTPSADHAKLLANTVAIFAGTADSNARPEVAEKLAAIESTARNRLERLANAGAGELFDGDPLGTDDVNLRQSFQYLYEIALATKTPGGAPDLVDNIEVQHQVVDGLVWLHENHFGDQDQGYYGNWHNWEIGIPTHVSKTLALLADVVADYRPGLIETYVASLDAYLRNGKDGDVDLDSRFHTGANLADITTNRIIQGALLGDDARIAKAVGDQSTVFATIDPYNIQHNNTDGYYEDGSFIQHHSVAYTGSYGKALLSRVVQSVKILDSTTYASGGDLVNVVSGWIRDGFAPLIFEGYMMEIVKGRAVSRTTTGYTDVGIIVEAIVDLASYAEDAEALMSYVKFINSGSPETLDPSRFVSPVTIPRYADILADDSIPAADLNPAERSVAFNAMDKNVHIRPGFAFALARSSELISKYEYMLGENLMPWFQADGTHYLYLSGQDQTEAFGVNFYTTVSPYRLPGVTSPVEERQTIPQLYGEQWYENPEHPLEFTSSSESQNKYVYFPRGTNTHSGGATLGAFGTASFVQSEDVPYVDKQAGILPEDFVVYQNASSKKSWFMLDDEIVVLVAGASGQAGRAAVTTLDSRIAEPSDDVTISGEVWDGSRLSGTGTGKLRWVRYANATAGAVVGYAFLDEQQATVAFDEVSHSQRIVRERNPDELVTKNVFGVSVDHPVGSVGSLAYVIAPNASESALAGYGADGPLTVIANNARVQGVKHIGLGLVAATVFAGGWHRAERVAIDGPASVIVKRNADGTLSLAVSDPTMNRRRVTVVVNGRPMSPVSVDDGVDVRRVRGGTEVTVTTHEAYGRSFSATLR